MENLNLKLKIWRQSSPNDKGAFVSYDVSGLNTHMSFLEMLDVLNEKLVVTGDCLLYTSPSPRDGLLSRMPSSA